MAAYRNVLLALAATGLLVGGLVFLFPSPTQAALVHLTSGGVGVPSSDPGAPFDVTFRVAIPDGEHIPADFVQVLVAPGGNTLSGGTLQASPDPFHCDARTVGGTATVTILSITGGTRVSDSFFGYGYDVQVSGGGYEFVSPSSVFTGTGYGYGAGDTGDTTITVKVRITGCAITYAGGTADLRMQAFIGQVGETLKSFPVSVTFYDPAGAAVTDGTDAANVTVTQTLSSSGGQNTTDLQFTMPGASDGLNASETVTVGGLPAGTGFSQVTLTTSQPLPEGSRLTLTMESSTTTGGTLPSRASPPFGVNPTALSAQTNNDPAFVFQVRLFVPGSGEVDAADYFSSVTFSVDVPNTFFTNLGRTISAFRVVGFNDSTGQLKPTQPTIVQTSQNAGPPVTWTVNFTVTDFSSFAGVASRSTGGGGGGGPAPSVQPPVSPPVTTPPITPPVTTPPTGPADRDGDGFTDDVETLLGTDPDDAGSVPDFRVDATVTRVGGGFHVTWGEPPAPVAGFQVWRSTSPWVLVAELGPDARSYTDSEAPEGAVYVVTFFLAAGGPGHVAPGTEPGDVLPGFPVEGEGVAPGPEQSPAGPTQGPAPVLGTGKWWALTVLVVLAAAAVAVGVAVLLKRKEHP